MVEIRSKEKIQSDLQNIMKANLLGLNRHYGENNYIWKGGIRKNTNHPCPQCKKDRICEGRNAYRICNECHRNREKTFDWNEWRKKTQAQAKEFAIQYLGGKCMKCGVSDLPACCYHFHHRKDEVKEFNLGHKFNQKINQDIINEIDKCDLFCANCHAIETWN